MANFEDQTESNNPNETWQDKGAEGSSDAQPEYGLTVTGVIGKSFGIYFDNLMLLTGLALLPVLPVFLAGVVAVVAGAEGASTAAQVAVTLLVFLGFIAGIALSIVVEAAIMMSLLKIIRDGQSVSFRESFQLAKGKIWLVFLLSLVVGLVVVLGFIALIVPGILFVVWYLLSVPAALDQNLGVKEAMAESKRLAKPNFGLIIGVVLLFFVIGFALSIIPIVNFFAGVIMQAVVSVATVYLYLGLKRRQSA